MNFCTRDSFNYLFSDLLCHPLHNLNYKLSFEWDLFNKLYISIFLEMSTLAPLGPVKLSLPQDIPDVASSTVSQRLRC